MVSPLVADALVVVALVGFYGGLVRDFAATTGSVSRRVGLALSLGPYVAGGVGTLLALATVATEVVRTRPGVALSTAIAVGLSLLFAVVFGLFFRFGVAAYAALLRVGLDLSGS